MGWIQDGAYGHEGWVANVLDDGRVALGTTGAGVLVDEVTAGDRSAGYQVRGYPTGSQEVLVPWERVVTWQVRCECGWKGSSRAAVTDEDGDRDAVGGSDEMFLPEWKAHVAPLVALSNLKDLVDAQRALEADIEETIRLARHSGASWSEIGRTARMTKQGAQQRWGALPSLDSGPR